jgi:hypothetical protein
LGYVLSKEPKVQYSPSELKVFEIVSRYSHKKKELPTTKVVTLDFYEFGELPFNADIIIGGTIRSLQKKMDVNREAVKLERVKFPGQLVMWKIENRTNATKRVGKVLRPTG